MKVLNLDKFVGAEKRQLVIGGVSYPVDEMTVENFIATTKAADAIKDTDSVAVQLDATIDMIVRSVPSLTRDALDGLSLAQLQAIVAFVRGDEVDGVETQEQPEGEDAGK
jgi:hypothetical protein